MPLFNNSTTIPVPAAVPEPPVVDTATVYNNPEVQEPLIRFIEGNSWTVDYYGQFVGDDDVLANNDDIAAPSLNQYQLVRSLELRLAEGITSSTDTQQVTTVTGNAMVYPVLIPLVGDVIVAKLEDGVTAEFAVTAVERQSLFKESAWSIDFTMTRFADAASMLVLTDKVVTDLMFDITKLSSSVGAIRTQSEYDRNVSKNKLMLELVDSLYEEYYDVRHDTLLFSVGDDKVYDPFAIEFLARILPPGALDGWDRPAVYDFKNTHFTGTIRTLWDALLSGKRSTLNRCVKEMTNLSSQAFNASHTYTAIDSMGLTQITYPTVVDGLAIKTLELTDPTAYVFNDAFYQATVADYTPLELLVSNLLDGEMLNYTDITDTLTDIATSTPADRFYHITVVIALLLTLR